MSFTQLRFESIRSEISIVNLIYEEKNDAKMKECDLIAVFRL